MASLSGLMLLGVINRRREMLCGFTALLGVATLYLAVIFSSGTEHARHAATSAVAVRLVALCVLAMIFRESNSPEPAGGNLRN